MTDQKPERGPVQVRQMIRPLVAEFSAAVHEELARRGIKALTLFSTKLSSFIGVGKKEDGSWLNGKNEEEIVLKKPQDLLFVADGEYGERVIAVDLLDTPLGQNDLHLLKVKPLLKRFGIEYRLVPPGAHRGRDRKQAVLDVVKALTDGTFRNSKREMPKRQIEVIVEAAKLAEKSGFTCFHEPSLDSIFDVEGLWLARQRRQCNGGGPDFAITSRVDALITTVPPNARPIVGIEFDGKEHRSNPDTQARDCVKDKIFLAGGIPLIRIDSRDMDSEKVGWREIRVRRLFLKLLVEHLAEIGDDALRIKRSLPESWRQQFHTTFRPVIGGGRQQGLHSALSGMLKMSVHSGGGCGESCEDAEDECISADYAHFMLESARKDSNSFPIPPGLWTSFKAECKPENKDILRAELLVKPGWILRAGGYRREENPLTEELRVQVIGSDTLRSGVRSLASDILRLVLCNRAAQTFDSRRREELLSCYERGIRSISN